MSLKLVFFFFLNRAIGLVVKGIKHCVVLIGTRTWCHLYGYVMVGITCFHYKSVLIHGLMLIFGTFFFMLDLITHEFILKSVFLFFDWLLPAQMLTSLHSKFRWTTAWREVVSCHSLKSSRRQCRVAVSLKVPLL